MRMMLTVGAFSVTDIIQPSRQSKAIVRETYSEEGCWFEFALPIEA